jgi:hypothetical protein
MDVAGKRSGCASKASGVDRDQSVETLRVLSDAKSVSARIVRPIVLASLFTGACEVSWEND